MTGPERERALALLVAEPEKIFRLLGVHRETRAHQCRYCRVAWPCVPARVGREALERLRQSSSPGGSSA